MAHIIDGKEISGQIKAELKETLDSWGMQGITAALAVVQVGNDPASDVYVRNKKRACEALGIRSLAYELPGTVSMQGITAALAVVQVGNDPASDVYVRNKKRACEALGIRSLAYELPGTVSQEELLCVIKELNGREDVDGILVQLPLPGHIDEKAVLNSVSPEKDVDGFHPYNVGALSLNGREDVDGILVQLPLPGHIDEKAVLNSVSPEKDVDGFHPYNVGALSCGEDGFVPATPAGIVELLKRSGIGLDGKECVVVGRSNIVGKPVAQLLLAENATVTITHSHTKNLAEVTRAAILSGNR